MYIWRSAFPEITVSEGLSYNEVGWSTMAEIRADITKKSNGRSVISLVRMLFSIYVTYAGMMATKATATNGMKRRDCTI